MKFDFKNIVLFIISFSVIFLMLLLVVNKNKTGKINVDNIKPKVNGYLVYNIDDEVMLLDNSEWYVLNQNTNYDKEITLISKNRINDQKVDNINYYLEEVYMDRLCRSLSLSRDQVSDIRLLNTNDIQNLYNTSDAEFNIRFDTSKYKLLSNNTIVNYYLNNKMLSLCSEGLCENDNSDIRVVIRIAKHFIKNKK